MKAPKWIVWESRQAFINVLLRLAVLAVLGFVIFLQLSTIISVNRELQHHRHTTETLIKANQGNVNEHREANQGDHNQIKEDVNSIKEFFCELVRTGDPSRITEGQRKACE